MAQDYLLKFGALSLSALAEAASGVPTFTGSYVTGPATQIFPTVIDLGAIGGQNNRSEMFAKVNINVTALSSSGTLADATNYWTFNPVVEASKDGTNYSIVSTLPVDLTASRVFYAAGGVSISGDSSLQLYVPLYSPAGTINNSITISGTSDPRGAQGTVVAEDNYRFFRVRLLARPGVTGGGATGANRTVTFSATAAMVNAKDGGI
jgi:hypothetical protein